MRPGFMFTTVLHKKLLFIIPWLNSQFYKTVTLWSVWLSLKLSWKGMNSKQLRKPSCSFGLRELNSSLIDWLIDHCMTNRSKTWPPCRIVSILQFALLTVTFFECPWSAFLCDKEIYWLASWQKPHLNHTWEAPVKEKFISRCIYGSHPTWDMLQL